MKKHLVKFLESVSGGIFAIFAALFSLFPTRVAGMSVGLRQDQQAIYLRDMYKAEYDSYKSEPTKHDVIFKRTDAKKAPGDKMTQLLGAGNLTRHLVENQDINFRSPVEGWSYYVRYWTFSDGLVFSKEAIEDVNTDKVGNLLKGLADTWGDAVRYEKETFAATVFNRGGDLLGEYVFNGSHTGNTAPYGDLLYDGKPLFNVSGNTRSSKGGGTYYNSVAGLALSPSTFEQLYNLYTVTIAFNEQDREVENEPDTLLTEAGAQSFLAKRIMKSSNGLPGTQLNDYNPYEGLCEPVSWRYLSDSSAFYIGKKAHKDFQFHDRQSPDIRFFRDETNRSYKVSIDVRFGVLIKNFRAWVKGGGSFA